MTNIIIKTLMIRSHLFDYNDYNDTQVHYAEDFDIVMPMYNLMEYSDAYLNTSRSLWYYYRDEPALYYNGNIIKGHVSPKNLFVLLISFSNCNLIPRYSFMFTS